MLCRELIYFKVNGCLFKDLLQDDVFVAAEFAEFGEKRFVHYTVRADALFFFFTVDDHTPRAGEHGEQEADMLEKWILLGGEFEPESLGGIRN